MLHENAPNEEIESQEVMAHRQRWSLGLLAVFSLVYAGFIGLCAFAYAWFSSLDWFGIPAPVWYGLGLILLALGIAGLYGRLTRAR